MVATRRRDWTRVVAHPVLLVGLLLTTVALIAFAGQDLPVLFIHDVGMIGLSLVPLAMAGTVASAGTARQGGTPLQIVGSIAVIASTVAAAAVVGYRAVDGIGWPTWRIGFGPAFVVASSAVGVGIGQVLHRRFAALAVSSAVAVALVAPAGAVATGVLARDFAPPSREDCAERDSVRYCFIAEYEPLVDDWAYVVERVLARVPPEVAAQARRLPVIQGVDREARVGQGRGGVLARPLLGWGRPGGGEGNAQAALALGVAAVSVQLATGLPDNCSPPRAEEVVAWWLAGQVSPSAARQVAATGAYADNVRGTNYAESPVPSVAASRYAEQLLDRPVDDVARSLRRHWDRYTDDATPAAELAVDFDLREVAGTGRGD